MTLQDSYINAVSQLLASGADFSAVRAGLATTLKERGHQQLERRILEGLLREYAASNTQTDSVTVASAADVGKYADKIASVVLDNSATATTIDPTIVGGYVIEANSVRHDHSFKSALIALYKNITTN